MAWKTRGPTPEFRAHADLQTVSVTCKLCIEVATRIQERERARAQNARADLSALSQSAPVKTAPEDDALEGSAGTQSARAKNARIESVTRPCSCPLATTTFLQRASLARPPRLHHLYVRERGTFFYQDVFVRSDHLSVSSLHAATLEAFTKAGHIPTWKRWGVYVTLYKRTEPWRVYKVFPVRSKQRDILYGNASFQNEMGLRTYLEKHPCPLLEVIFI